MTGQEDRIMNARTPRTTWRTGTKVKRTVYEGNQIMFLCTTAEDAERVVALLNGDAERAISLALAEALEEVWSGKPRRFLVNKVRAALAQYTAQNADSQHIGSGGESR